MYTCSQLYIVSHINMKTTDLEIYMQLTTTGCNINFPKLTFPVTVTLAITVQAIKGKPACCSPSLDPKCTLTVLGRTRVGNKLLVHVLCAPQTVLSMNERNVFSCTCVATKQRYTTYSLRGLYCVHCILGCWSHCCHMHRLWTCCLAVVRQTVHSQEDSQQIPHKRSPGQAPSRVNEFINTSLYIHAASRKITLYVLMPQVSNIHTSTSSDSTNIFSASEDPPRWQNETLRLKFLIR